MTNKVLAGKVADLQATTDAPPAKGKGKKPSKSNAPQVVPRVAMVLDEIKMSGLAKRIGVDVSDIEPGRKRGAVMQTSPLITFVSRAD